MKQFDYKNPAAFKRLFLKGVKKIKKDPLALRLPLASVLTAILFLLFLQPERSVENFCQVVREEKTALIGNVNEEKRLEVYKRLEAVAPEEIRPDITTIRKGYETVVTNPAAIWTAGFGMMGAEGRRTEYIQKNCPDFSRDVDSSSI